MINKFLIIAAVLEEVKNIKRFLEKDEAIIKDTMIIERGIIFGKNVDILVTGPGILNSIHALTVYLENNEKPELIIQTVCAGGFSDLGVSIGDIGIASSETYIHLGVENPENRIIPSPLPFSITKTGTIKNQFPTNEDFSKKSLEIIRENTDLKADIYPFITVSEVTSSKEKAANLFNNFKAGMENMEGAGSAYISYLYELPFIEIRSTSNETGVLEKCFWDFPTSFNNSGQAVLELIKGL